MNIQDKIINSDLNLNKIYQVMILINLGNIDFTMKLLNVSKKSILKTLDSVEKSLDILIIKKISKNSFVEITKEGLEFMYYAKNIFQELYNTTEKIKNNHGINDSHIFIAINFASTGLYEINNAIEKYKKKNANINISLETFRDNNRIEKFLTDGIINIGITSQCFFNEEIEYIKLIESPWVIVGKPEIKNHWSNLKFIYSNYIFVDKRKDTNTEYFEFNYNKFFGEKIIVEVYEDEQALMLAEKGIGAVFVNKKIAQPYIDKGTLEIISESPFEFHINVYICVKKGIYKSLAIQSFINEIINVYN